MAGKKTGKRLLTWVLVLVMALFLLPLNALAKDVWSTEYGWIRIYLDDATKNDLEALNGLSKQVRIVSTEYPGGMRACAPLSDYWWTENNAYKVTAKKITSIDLAGDKAIGSSNKIPIPIHGNETYDVEVSEGEGHLGIHYLRIVISKRTPKPPKAPDAPNYENLKTLIGGITVNCTNTKASHASKNYTLIEDSYTTSEVAGDAANGYTYTVTINSQKYVAQFDADTNKAHDPKDGTATVTLEYKNSAWLVKSGTPISFNVECNAQPEPDPTPATVTLSDDEGKSLIKKHLTVNGDGLAEDTDFVVEITPKTEKEHGIIPSNLLAGTTSTVGTVTNNTFTSDFSFSDQNGNPTSLTFSAPGEYTFKVTEKNLGVEHMQYDDTEYTMTVNVTKDADENKLNAAVSFTEDGQTDSTGSITFNNTYKTPTYPVYVYAFFAHDNTQLTGDVTVNGKPIEWNEDAENGEYFVTLGVYRNGTTKEPTDDATLDALNVTEYELAKSTSKGNGTKNRVALKDITVYPSPSGKVCNGAAGYEESADNPSWHLDGQVDVYTVTYDDGMTEGEPTSAGYYFRSYTIAAAPERDGYTFTGWKDDNGDVYYPGDMITLKKDLKLVAQWTVRTDLSYTVNYLENDTNIVLHEKKIQTGVTFGAEINSADEIITINGYNYDSADKDKLTIGTDESKNVINIYYTKRTDLSYTVHYYLKNTTKPVANDKRVNGQTFNAVVKEEAIRISGYRVYGDSVKSITIDTGTNDIIFYYTRASRPAAPSKPTLNTGDHYAYVMGYPDGTVRPNGSITRAEVSAILFRLLSDKTRDEYFTTESSFTDVKAGAWYNNSIATLEKAGVIVDTAKGGAFRPNEAITRAELAAMLAQFSDAKPVKGVKFSDVSAEHWAYEAIAIAAKMGWIEGYPDGTFRPDATITRAEMMTLVNRALERVPSDEDHLLSKRVMLTFPDCKSGDWFGGADEKLDF